MSIFNRFKSTLRNIFWDKISLAMLKKLEEEPQFKWVFVFEIVPHRRGSGPQGRWWFSRSDDSYHYWGEIMHFSEIIDSKIVDRQYSDFIEKKSKIAPDDSFFELLNENSFFWRLDNYTGSSRGGGTFIMKFLSNDRRKSVYISNPHSHWSGLKYQDLIELIINFWNAQGFSLSQSWDDACQKYMED
ncbi:MAG: hypothetical protein F6J87_04640 [Spirulina sp. SIO3F2]|nr:hypothetical protein [Spirulina sp. SIO3F2]